MVRMTGSEARGIVFSCFLLRSSFLQSFFYFSFLLLLDPSMPELILAGLPIPKVVLVPEKQLLVPGKTIASRPAIFLGLPVVPAFYTDFWSQHLSFNPKFLPFSPPPSCFSGLPLFFIPFYSLFLSAFEIEFDIPLTL